MPATCNIGLETLAEVHYLQLWCSSKGTTYEFETSAIP